MPIQHVDLVASNAAMRRGEELRSLAELFMENTRLHPYHAAGVRRRAREVSGLHWQEVLRQSCKTYASSPRTALPSPRTLSLSPTASLATADYTPRMDLEEGIPFSRAALTAGHLSHLLFCAGGRSESAVGSAGNERWTGPSPSELHPNEIYVVLVDSEGLAPGVYHYNLWLHCLEALEPGPSHEVACRLEALLMDPTESHEASAAIITTAVPLRVCTVHGDRGYRLLLAQAGAIEERLRFSARALGFRARPVTHFYDERVDRLLGLDGVEELVVGLSLVGQVGAEIGP